MAKRKNHIALGWIITIAVFIIVLIAALVGAVWRGSTLPGQDLQQKWSSVASLIGGVVGFFTLLPIVWAVVKYRQVAEDQRKAKHYQAWQAISDAQGQPGSGGRIDALQDLHTDGAILAGVDLSGSAYLVGIQLPGARMVQANLQKAIMIGANLQGANLYKANLKEIDLSEANLQGAYLSEANLQGATLYGANLEGANLMSANLHGSRLIGANFNGADLFGVDFEEANLYNVNLQGSELSVAKLTTARNLTREQILSVRDRRGAKLPNDLKDLEIPEDAPEPEDQE